MAVRLVDVELLLLEALRPLVPRAVFLPATESDTDPDALLVSLNAYNGRRFGSGSAGLASEWDVALSIVGPSHEAAFDLAADTYAAVHALPGTQVAGVGGVARVEDVALPVRTATTVLGAQDLTQFDAAVTAVVRPA